VISADRGHSYTKVGNGRLRPRTVTVKEVLYYKIQTMQMLSLS